MSREKSPETPGTITSLTVDLAVAVTVVSAGNRAEPRRAALARGTAEAAGRARIVLERREHRCGIGQAEEFVAIGGPRLGGRPRWIQAAEPARAPARRWRPCTGPRPRRSAQGEGAAALSADRPADRHAFG